LGRWLTVVVLIAVVGCASPARVADGPPSATAPSSGSASAQRKAIEIALTTEPNALVTALGLVGRNARLSRYFHEFVNAYVTARDQEDEVSAHLAAALPSLDDGTWKVFPDGRMEVTWKLRPGITWHDGAPLTAEDIRFSWEVANDPAALVGATTIARFVDRVETPDPLTFIMYWKETQQFGGELGEREFDILPRHKLETAYRADPASIPNHPHLTNPEVFVGSGPYRPLQWERDSFLVLEAYDQYVLGRPKIDRVTVRVIGDSRTATSNVLAGTLDAVYQAVEFVEGRIIEREWAASGKGTVQFMPTSMNHLIPQFRPELTTPADLLNLPVRKALAHGINRQDLVDALDLGPEMIADSTGVPGTPIGDAVARTIARYPYDPNRAAALLAEVGWQPGSDGVLTKGGRPFDLELRVEGAAVQSTIYQVTQQNYQRVGINLTLNRSVGSQNLQDRVNFPGLLSSGLTVNNMIFAQRWHSNFIAGPPRYVGENRQGYVNPASDAALDRLLRAVRREDQLRYWAESWKVITEDVAAIPMFYTLNTYIVRKGLTGLQPRNPLGNAAYRVHQWDVQS
jgi:peptide/nickel transport system substrate-binding protein